MKITDTNSPVNTNLGNSSTMGIAAGAEAQISRMLRDQVYSDKRLAIVREYLCNAHDEHVTHKVDRPVEVTLTEETFTVRDFAKGLSEDHVRNIFGNYGASTKRKTNDLIGSYGIGSKSAHCYSDTFYVVSHFEGTQTTYACVLGNHGGQQMGQIHAMGSCPTTESGLEIRVDLNDGDYYKMLETLTNFINYCGFNIIATGRHKNVIKPLECEQEIVTPNFTVRVLKTEYASNYANIQMGGVNYDETYLPNNVKPRGANSLAFNCNIGSLGVTLSRESFEQDERYTAIKKEIEQWMVDRYTEEKKSHQTMDFEEVLTMEDNLWDNIEMNRDGDVFRHSKNSIYKEWSNFKQYLRLVDTKKEIKKVNGKYNLITVDTTNFDYWRTKAFDHYLATDQQAYVVGLLHYEQLSDEEQELFNPISARDIKYPSVQRNSYQVYQINGEKLGRHDCYQLFNYIFDTEFKAGDDDKCLEYAKKWYADNPITSRIELNNVSVHHTTDKNGYYHRNNYNMVFTCQTLMDQVGKLGVILAGSTEYNEISRTIGQMELEKQDRANLINNIRADINFEALSPKTQKLLNNMDVKQLKRFNKMISSVVTLTPMRSKIIRNTRYETFTREEYRKILQMTK